MTDQEFQELSQGEQPNRTDFVEGPDGGEHQRTNEGSSDWPDRQQTDSPAAQVEDEHPYQYWIGGGERQGETTRGKRKAKPRTKKDRIILLYEQGITNVLEIARRLDARPSYVAQVLQNAGLLSGYFDLYTTTTREQNVYSQYFRNVLSFKTVESARESVRRIDELYNHFEQIGDRAGQHQAMVVALTGKNRARWIGKQAEAEVFGEWLARH